MLVASCCVPPGTVDNDWLSSLQTWALVAGVCAALLFAEAIIVFLARRGWRGRFWRQQLIIVPFGLGCCATTLAAWLVSQSQQSAFPDYTQVFPVLDIAALTLLLVGYGVFSALAAYRKGPESPRSSVGG